MVDPGFPGVGCILWGGGYTNLIFDINLVKNCMKMNQNVFKCILRIPGSAMDFLQYFLSKLSMTIINSTKETNEFSHNTQSWQH